MAETDPAFEEILTFYVYWKISLQKKDHDLSFTLFEDFKRMRRNYSLLTGKSENDIQEEIWKRVPDDDQPYEAKFSGAIN